MIRLPASIPKTLLAGLLATLPTLLGLVFVRDTVFTHPPGDAAVSVALLTVRAAVVTGVPVALYVRYGTVTPAVVAGVILLLRTVAANPEASFFHESLILSAHYLGVYVVFGGVEFVLKNG
jgi:hypothetical protein